MNVITVFDKQPPTPDLKISPTASSIREKVTLECSTGIPSLMEYPLGYFKCNIQRNSPGVV